MSRNRKSAAERRKRQRIVLIVLTLLVIGGAIAWDVFYDPNAAVYARCRDMTIHFLGVPRENVTLPEEYDPEVVTHSVEGQVRVLTFPVEWVAPDGEVVSDYMHCIRDQYGAYQIYPHSLFVDPELEDEGQADGAAENEGTADADDVEPATDDEEGGSDGVSGDGS